MNYVRITLTLLIALFLQVLFVFADGKESPTKAALEFMEAYVSIDPAMAERICKEQLTVEDASVVNSYILDQTAKAEQLGYKVSYLRDNLYHVKIDLLSGDYQAAKVHIRAERKCPLRSFFNGTTRYVDETLDLIWEDNKWKVCSDLSSMF